MYMHCFMSSGDQGLEMFPCLKKKAQYIAYCALSLLFLFPHTLLYLSQCFVTPSPPFDTIFHTNSILCFVLLLIISPHGFPYMLLDDIPHASLNAGFRTQKNKVLSLVKTFKI